MRLGLKQFMENQVYQEVFWVFFFGGVTFLKKRETYFDLFTSLRTVVIICCHSVFSPLTCSLTAILVMLP